MRSRKKAAHEVEEQRDELFNKTRPVAPTKQVWRPKQKGNADASTLATTAPTPPKKDDAAPITSSTPPETSPLIEETLSPIYTLGDEDEMEDFEPMPARECMDINMMHYSPAGLVPISLKPIGGNRFQNIYLSS